MKLPNIHTTKTFGRFNAKRTTVDSLKVIRVIIYARVSSQKQLDNKEEDSIKSQIRHNMRFAEAFSEAGEKWVVVKVVIDDGRTGRNDKRDGLKEVRHLVETGQVDVVLVNRLSRAFRNTKLAHEFEEFLKSHNVRLVSRMEPGNTDTASEKFVRSIHHSMSEFASNQISEDVKRSIQTRLEAGLTSGGTPKPGYDSRDGHLFVVEEDAAIIREIFEMAENGMLPTEIANDLNRRRIRTRKRKSKSGNTTGGQRYRPEGVIKILQDPIYKGIFIHAGTEYPLNIDPIVSGEVWDKVQIALDRRPRKKEGISLEKSKHFMPLAGKVRCGCCNCAMKPSFSTKRKPDGTKEKYFYYLCSKHEKQGKESTCEVRRVPARLLERLLMEAFSEIAATPAVATRIVDKAPKANTTKIRALAKERQAMRNQLKELDAEVETVTEKILNLAGTVVGEKLRERVDVLTAQKNEFIAQEIQLNKEIYALKSDMLEPQKLQHALAHFAEAIKCLSQSEQQELYKLLFKSVIVNEGGKAKDPFYENTRRSREARRQLSVEVRLYTEAIQTLFGEESDSGRKSGFTIPLEIAHSRQKPMENCAIISPVHKECGNKSPKTRKRPKKTEHEIHRALRWKKEMEELGIGQNELARREGYSCPAVAAVMAWLKLSPEAVDFIKNIPEYKSTRSISRSYRKRLLGLNPSKQISAIKELLSKN